MFISSFNLDNETSRTEKVSQCPSQQNLHLGGTQYDFLTGFYYWICFKYEVNLFTALLSLSSPTCTFFSNLHLVANQSHQCASVNNWPLKMASSTFLPSLWGKHPRANRKNLLFQLTNCQAILHRRMNMIPFRYVLLKKINKCVPQKLYSESWSSKEQQGLAIW